MSQFDFDELIERRGSGSYKWDANQREFGNAALLPFWVADMDFAVAPAIREAIAQRLQHPVLGYEERPAAYAEAQ
ncbi:MAG: aspartate aminotransferase, partial [Woeseia sp.]